MPLGGEVLISGVPPSWKREALADSKTSSLKGDTGFVGATASESRQAHHVQVVTVALHTCAATTYSQDAVQDAGLGVRAALHIWRRGATHDRPHLARMCRKCGALPALVRSARAVSLRPLRRPRYAHSHIAPVETLMSCPRSSDQGYATATGACWPCCGDSSRGSRARRVATSAGVW